MISCLILLSSYQRMTFETLIAINTICKDWKPCPLLVICFIGSASIQKYKWRPKWKLVLFFWQNIVWGTTLPKVHSSVHYECHLIEYLSGHIINWGDSPIVAKLSSKLQCCLRSLFGTSFVLSFYWYQKFNDSSDKRCFQSSIQY